MFWPFKKGVAEEIYFKKKTTKQTENKSFWNIVAKYNQTNKSSKQQQQEQQTQHNQKQHMIKKTNKQRPQHQNEMFFQKTNKTQTAVKLITNTTTKQQKENALFKNNHKNIPHNCKVRTNMNNNINKKQIATSTTKRGPKNETLLLLSQESLLSRRKRALLREQHKTKLKNNTR